MRPQDGLYEQTAARIEEITPELYRHEGMRVLANDIASAAREHNVSVSMPTLSHVQYAINRELSTMGTSLGFPKGKIYKLPEYDSFRVGDVERGCDTGIEYSSRLYVATSDETGSKTASWFGRLLDEIEEGKPSKSGAFAIIHSLTPTATKKIHTASTITFIMVQSVSGENYFFTIAPNANKGSVLAEEAMSDESDYIRQRIGRIDKVIYQAMPCDAVMVEQIKGELQRAKDSQDIRSVAVVQETKKVMPMLQALGKRALTRLPFTRERQK